MKKFVEKKKIFFYIAITIIVILIIVYSYFYSPEYENITEENFLNEITIENNESIEQNEDKAEGEESLVSVHIAGSVVKEGVIEIEENSRLIDVIEEAGGLTEEADLSNVNLAYSIKDGQKIYIPNKDDEEEKGVIMTDMPNYIVPGNEEETKGDSNSLMVNINSATQTELEELTGIGPSIASNIMKYRKENGNFTSVEEVRNVEGIGESKYNQIKDNICI